MRFTIPESLRKTSPHHLLEQRAVNPVVRIIAMAVVAVLVFLGSMAAAVWADINTTIEQGQVKVLRADGTGQQREEILDPFGGQTIEILILGQDTREGEGNSDIGGTADYLKDNHQADTTMVLQIAADRSWVNLVSIPRDSIVDMPSCMTTQGELPAMQGVMFNSIFAMGYSTGGDLASAASCTLTAVNSLTGLNIQHFAVVDFQGLKNMIDALGGVDICIPVDLYDTKTKLNLSKGMQHLDGTQATQYARMRHGTGTDGSDIMRTTRQQYLIKQLLHEATSKNLFTQSGQLYQLAKTALQSLNLSEGLADITSLVGLATSMVNLSTDHLYSQTVPITTAPYDPNRVVWAPKAANVWAKLQQGQPLVDQPATTTSDTSDNAAASSDADSTDAVDSTGTAGEGNPTDKNSAQVPSPNIPNQQSPAEETPNPSTGAPAEPQPDPVSGLITDEYGNLIDLETGGIVDPETGAIRDAETGQFVGLADQYLNNVVCAVS